MAGQTPHAEPGLICPLHRKDVSKVCHLCPWWTQLRGKHPQTGVDLDSWNCAIGILPTLLVENAKQTRSTAAATEAFRNDVMQARPANLDVLAALQAAIIPPKRLEQKP